MRKLRYQASFLEDARLQLRALHPELKTAIRTAIDLILADPSVGKALKEDLAGLRSFRVQRFRIVYQVKPERIVEFLSIGHRRTVYQSLKPRE